MSRIPSEIIINSNTRGFDCDIDQAINEFLIDNYDDYKGGYKFDYDLEIKVYVDEDYDEDDDEEEE